MRIAWGVSWDDSKKGRAFGALFAVLLAFSLIAPAQSASMAEGTEALVSVIVREQPGAGAQAENLIEAVGGSVERHIRLIDGFTAEVPASALDDLERLGTVHSVTPNRPLKLLSTSDYDPNAAPGSMVNVTNSIKARELWKSGYTGKGVDVALVDSGVVPVNGLTTPGKVINGPDMSFERGAEDLHFLDTFGHGTHMAGIIAGKDDGAPVDHNNSSDFLGVAPDSRIVSIKVANAVGATDVSQVLSAIDWVVHHRNSNGLNIRVLNLSFGTDGVQDYTLDPLTYAAEVAWHKGIVVVVAAGNQQFGSSTINNPAYDPYVIAVGATDTMGTPGHGDDVTPDWTARGDGIRNPDFVAPGKSVVSLRNPGSFTDDENPSAVVAGRFFKGSGTSQAAAVTSGAAALLLSQRPGLTPDQVKALLVGSAKKLPYGDPQAQGAGTIDLSSASKAAIPTTVQSFPRATGLGSLDAARGSVHVVDPDGNVLTGEQDIFGYAWDAETWAAEMWSGAGWSGAGWSGAGWSGAGWSGAGWSKAGWSKAGWSEDGWLKAGWSGAGWSGAGWSKAGWSGAGWSKAGWSGAGWSGAGWSGAGWSGAGWSKAGWSGAGWS